MTRLFIRAALLAVFVIGASESAHADLNISKKPTQNMSCSGGVCTATAKGANLNVTDLTNLLAAGDTTVKFGGGARAIQVQDGFSWTSTSRLTLDANTSVGFHKPVTVAGQGALTITYNDGGTVGDLNFFDKGKVDFWNLSSSLIINGTRYTLVGDVKTLARDLNGNFGLGSYALAHAYDASVDGTYGGAPITTLQGTIEGLGHSFLNLSIHGAGGLILTILDGSVRDLSLLNVDILNEGEGGDDGAMAAGIRSGTLLACTVSGTVENLNRDANTGGLVGYVEDSLVDRSRSTAAVYSKSWVGGLVGWITSGRITRSYSTASVTGRQSVSVGGLVGHNDGAIANSYSAGAVSVDHNPNKPSQLGGLVGTNHRGTLMVSYSLTTVANHSDFGGLVGDNENTGQASDGYWDLDTSGVDNPSKGCGDPANCPGVTGLSDAQLKSGLPAGFDPNIWGQSPTINNGYPYLLANPPK